ncbi:HDOD domain-containing protein [Jeongeupia naejangsanensis]|uniref:HDOD domain-containing protein n=1 Tax=Jeongeupia naejangsanensis TaxID=613195 RepID=A0ABS2BFU2_9NEIS|nr:HDOD domain-containing protein [Jeongeupia naejangsanensis]MBM3114476.1 HDOD domain-containing protein [Jeongeupia naejangsanensis]
MTLQSRYRITEMLLQDACWAMHRGLDEQSSALVLLLSIRPACDETIGRQLLALRHPQLLVPFDVIRLDDTSWLALGEVAAEPLVQRLKREGPVTPVLAVTWVLDSLAAWQAAQQQGMSLAFGETQLLIDARNGPWLLPVPDAAGANPLPAAIRLLQRLLGDMAARPELAELQPLLAGDGSGNLDVWMQVLRGWLEAQGREIGAAGTTLDRLLWRMQRSGDFPALSQAISNLNQIQMDDAEHLQGLSDVVLRDFALTNKLLRLANSAIYGQYGGTISTVSRAIVILGFNTIHSLAVTVLLFEHLHDKHQAQTIKEATLRAFFSGLLARALHRRSGARDAEETLVCGMLHHLGRLLTIYYFPDDNLRIDQRCREGRSETLAAKSVLGLDFAELGSGVAKQWRFPERICRSMQCLPDGVVRPAHAEQDRLRVYANFGHELLAVLEQPCETGAGRLEQLQRRYLPATGLTLDDLSETLHEVSVQFRDYLQALGMGAGSSAFLRRLDEFDAAKLKGVASVPDTIDRARLETTLEDATRANTAVIAAGVQDIANTLVGGFKLNDLLRMVLETMYRGVGFDRVLLCTREPKRSVIVGRFGFGSDIASVIPGFRVELGAVMDVFQVALQRNADILIEDTDDATIRDRIPAWHSQHLAAKTFIVLPLVLDKQVIGLLYGDRRTAGSLKIGNEELNLLKTLRNQALMAIRQAQS